MPPPSIPLGARIERAQTTCNRGRARSQSRSGALAAGSWNAHRFAAGAHWATVERRQSPVPSARHVALYSIPSSRQTQLVHGELADEVVANYLHV